MQKTLDQEFENLDRTIRQLTVFAQSYRYDDLGSPHQNHSQVTVLHKIRENLLNFSLSGNLISQIYFYSSPDGVVVSNHSIYLSPQNFYQKGCFMVDDLSLEEFEQQYLKNSNSASYLFNQAVVLDGKKTDALIIIQPVYLAQMTKPSYMLIAVDNQELEKAVGADFSSEFAMITDTSGRRQFPSTPLEERFPTLLDKQSSYYKISNDDGEYTVSTGSSEYRQSIYYYISPISDIEKTTASLMTLTIILFAVTLVTATVLSLTFSYNNYKPIKRLLTKFQGNASEITQKSNEYFLLDQAASRVLSDNKSLSNQNQIQQIQICGYVFHDLIYGRGLQGEDVSARLSELGFCVTSELYLCVVCSFLHEDEVLCQSFTRRDQIHEILHDELDGLIHTIDIDRYMTVLIFGCNQTEYEKLEALISTVNRKIQSEAETDMIFAIGSAYRDISNINKSFEQAFSFCQYAKIDGIPTVYHCSAANEEIEKPGNENDFSLSELDAQIIKCVMDGQEAAVRSTMENYLQQLIKSQRPTIKKLRYLLFHLHDTWVGMLYRINRDTPSDDITGQLSLEFSTIADFTQAFGELTDYFCRLCNEISQRQKENTRRTGESIIEYVDTNYTDPDLSLTTLSTEFGLCEPYISSRFREQSGKTFSSYVENKRMQLACTMLKNKSNTIDKIANAVGYNSSHTFRRVFKKAMQISPSEYR